MNASEDLQRRIVQSGLLSQDELESLAAASLTATNNSDQALLEFLVAERRLTDFQAAALAAGFTGPFMLGPYRVHERIAAGRLGDLFRAVHVEFDQPVSLKVFSSALARDPEQFARMQREVRVAVQLDHPQVVRSFQIGRIGDVHFLAFEDLHGETLEARLARSGKLPYPEACRLLRQAALGLESLHEAEIAHLDLRPANLWINEHDQLKIVEFGTARDALSFLDQLDQADQLPGYDPVLGDSRYLAPEAAADADAADPRSDIYSLGCSLYHVLAGQPPFGYLDSERQRQAHADEPPRSLTWHVPDLPQPLAEIVARALAKLPDDRPTIAELDFALERYVDDRQTSLAPTETWSPEFLAWVQEANLLAGGASPSSSGLNDEMAEFLDWLATSRSPPSD
ncbi:MAG TPA: serine/threonine-protein kinase [Pirellulales bacterium]|jgi:serine/threonine-protein kinase|nr:serine/threonine-protein kinase [Pirellulales bacterium]